MLLDLGSIKIQSGALTEGDCQIFGFMHVGKLRENSSEMMPPFLEESGIRQSWTSSFWSEWNKTTVR